MVRYSSPAVPRLLLAILVVGLLMPHRVRSEEEWTEIGQSKTGTRWYIDTPVCALEEDTITVWVKSIPDTASPFPSEEEEDSWGLLRNVQKKYFGDYDHTEALWEIDCSRDTVRILYFIARDRKSMPVTSSLTPNAPWMPVVPGSVGETLREALCGSH